MKSVSGKDFAKVLERHGWSFLHVQGSPHIYGKTGSDIRLSVPIHGNQTIKSRLAQTSDENGRALGGRVLKSREL